MGVLILNLLNPKFSFLKNLGDFSVERTVLREFRVIVTVVDRVELQSRSDLRSRSDLESRPGQILMGLIIRL